MDHAKDLYTLRTSAMPHPQSLGSHHMPFKFHMYFIDVTEIVLKSTRSLYLLRINISGFFIFSSLITISLSCGREQIFKNHSLNNLPPKSPLRRMRETLKAAFVFWRHSIPFGKKDLHQDADIPFTWRHLCASWRTISAPGSGDQLITSWLRMIITIEYTCSAQLLTSQRHTKKPGGQDNAKCSGIFIPT